MAMWLVGVLAGDRRVRGAARIVVPVVAAAAATVAALSLPVGAQPDTADADRWCLPDPAGDTFHDRDDGRAPADDPAADIRQLCAAHDEGTLDFELGQAAASDADMWGDAGAVLWFIDTTGDEEHDHLVELTVDDGEPVVEVVDRRGDEDAVTCTPSGAVDGTRLVVADVDAACLDEPEWLRVTATTVRDPAPDDEDPATLVYDLAAERVSVAPPSGPPRRDIDRLAGEGRVATSAEIAREAFGDDAGRVYLARADDFADALAAASVAGARGAPTDGPVLLVPSCGDLPAETGEVLASQAPTAVVALGGDEAVCDELLREAADAADATPERIAGRDRWATAAAIALEGYPDGADIAYVATGERFADALAAGALADGPVLLAPACGPAPPPVSDALDELDPESLVAVGGTAALCDEIVTELADGRDTDRLRDERYRNRFGTARAVAAAAFPDGAGETYLARGDDFADALSAASLSGGPVLLTPPCGDLPAPSARGVGEIDPGRVVALGGQAAVCDQVQRHAANS